VDKARAVFQRTSESNAPSKTSEGSYTPIREKRVPTEGSSLLGHHVADKSSASFGEKVKRVGKTLAKPEYFESFRDPEAVHSAGFREDYTRIPTRKSR
jgi:hypothetical protein